MAGMNAMGGPVGGGMPMMNNGGAAGGRQPMPVTGSDQRERLNTYIYEYFLRNGMFDCARSLLNSDQPINTLKDSPGRHQEDSADGDSKEDIDSKRPDDLPLPNLPKETPESCFLYEWWCVFWDMFNAQRGKTDSTGRQVANYISHTQVRPPSLIFIVQYLRLSLGTEPVETRTTSCNAPWNQERHGRITSKLSADDDERSEWFKYAAKRA